MKDSFTESHDGEDRAGRDDNGDRDDGEIEVEKDGQLDVEGSDKPKKGKKSAEEKAAEDARGEAATEAVSVVR